MLLAGLTLAGLAAGFEDTSAIVWSEELLAVIAFNGPIATAFCFWAALVVAASLPSVSTSIGFLGVPVAGLVFSWLALGEAITMSLAVGFVLILGGIWCISTADRRLSAA